MDILLQSTQDYSVQVSDPTEDAIDPDEWSLYLYLSIVMAVIIK